MKNERKNDLLRTLFIAIGVIVSVSALVAVAYTVFKKYFTISFECDCDDCDDCFCDDLGDCEPICCCEDDADAVCECDDCCCDNAEDAE